MKKKLTIESKNNNKSAEVIVDDQTVEFFKKIVSSLTAACAAKTESGDKLPLHMTTFDVLGAVLRAEDTQTKQREIIQKEKEFKGLRNEFVKGVKKGIREEKEKNE